MWTRPKNLKVKFSSSRTMSTYFILITISTMMACLTCQSNRYPLLRNLTSCQMVILMIRTMNFQMYLVVVQCDILPLKLELLAVHQKVHLKVLEKDQRLKLFLKKSNTYYSNPTWAKQLIRDVLNWSKMEDLLISGQWIHQQEQMKILLGSDKQLLSWSR